MAGAAATAIGFSGVAFAQSPKTHVLTVRMPDGGVAQIRYTGNVAPRISFDESPAPIEVFAPMPSVFGPGSPFAALDRISAEMNRQAAAMFRQAEAMTRAVNSGRMTETALHNLPPDSSGYSFVSTMSGNGVCTESVQITSQGNGAPPRVVRHSSGNCGAMPGSMTGGTTGAATLPAAREPQVRPDVVWTSAHGAHPDAGLVREIPPAQR